MKKVLIATCIACFSIASQAKDMTVADQIKYLQYYANSCSNDSASQATITKVEIISHKEAVRRTRGQYGSAGNDKVLVINSKSHDYPHNYSMTELQAKSATVKDFKILLGTQTCVDIGDE